MNLYETRAGHDVVLSFDPDTPRVRNDIPTELIAALDQLATTATQYGYFRIDLTIGIGHRTVTITAEPPYQGDTAA